MAKSIIPDAALNQHIAVLGKTGSGKTYAAKGIVEHLIGDHRQVCVLDPTSAWWGLRLAADGKSRGFDIVLIGGQHGDIPLAEKSGEAVARLVTEQGASVVIDSGAMTVGQYTRWFIDFAGTLFTTVRNPLHLVIDEAHHFMPQGKSPDVDAGRMLHAGNRLMSGGRSKGIRGLLITQRPQKLHKDSLTCADTLIAMRLISPQDRAAVKEWIDGAGDPEQGKNVLGSLAGLQRGEGWVWYPEGGHLARVTFGKIKTYDSSATPAHGAKAGPKVAEIDLAAVKAALAEAVKEAEANDPKLLRAKIADLERKFDKSARTVQTDPAAIEKARTEGAKARDQEWKPIVEALERWNRDLTGRIGKAAGKLTEAGGILHLNGDAPTIGKPDPIIGPKARLIGEQGQIIGKTAGNITKPAQAITRQTQAVSRPIPENRALDSGSDSGLTNTQRRILDTIATLNVRGIDVNRESVARWLAIHPNGGRYGSDLAALRAAGHLEGFMLTPFGSVVACAQATGADAALRALPEEAMRRTLQTIIDAGAPLSREELAELLGIHPNGGRYGSNLAWLRTMGVITDRGPIAATEGLQR